MARASSCRQPICRSCSGGNGANTVKLVLHEKNQGKGAGVRSGLEHVTGELVLIQDADLEYDPRDYPQLITPILEGHADAVFGNRFHDGPHRVPRYWRYVLNRCFSLLCNMLTGLSIHDVTACYKVFRREIVLANPHLAPTASALKPRSRSSWPSSAPASTKCRSSITAGPTPKARRSAGPTASSPCTTCCGTGLRIKQWRSRAVPLLAERTSLEATIRTGSLATFCRLGLLVLVSMPVIWFHVTTHGTIKREQQPRAQLPEVKIFRESFASRAGRRNKSRARERTSNGITVSGRSASASTSATQRARFRSRRARRVPSTPSVSA